MRACFVTKLFLTILMLFVGVGTQHIVNVNKLKATVYIQIEKNNCKIQ